MSLNINNTTHKVWTVTSKNCYLHSPESQLQNLKFCERKTSQPMIDLQGVYRIRHLMMKEKREHQDWKNTASQHLFLAQRESKYKHICQNSKTQALESYSL